MNQGVYKRVYTRTRGPYWNNQRHVAAAVKAIASKTKPSATSHTCRHRWSIWCAANPSVPLSHMEFIAQRRG